MINFPVITNIEVADFGLYPGKSDQPGLSIDFTSGLTLILGANGLGKSTLIQIMYRCLTGPYEISGLDKATELGNMNTTPTVMVGSKRGTFASRDATGARSASATLRLNIGLKSVVIKRRLSDLTLISLQIDDENQPSEELSFQRSMWEMVGLSSFGDFILLLRHLTFYFEDRRSLIWDPSAQRQLLRLLFLPPFQAARWISEERGILELDSRMRNLRAILGREEQTASSHSDQAARSPDIRGELQTLDLLQATDSNRRDELDSQLNELDAHRQALRLRHLQLEQEHESNKREYERSKLAAIRARFPSTDETSAYILARLISDAHCLVCGNHAPEEAIAEYNDRIAHIACVVCGTDLHGTGNVLSGAEFADAAMASVLAKLSSSAEQLAASETSRSEAEGTYSGAVVEVSRLDSTMSQRSARIEYLLRQLPPEESERREQLSELSLLRRRVEESRRELDEKLAVFSSFVETENRSIQEASERIKHSFIAFAEGFLLETCSLIWAPYRSRVGQTGEPMLYPAFGLEMTGSNFTAPTRRDGPDQVSESQREFIDLAFRMSLMQIASSSPGGATLVIDAPESSLDAVFAERATQVLSAFGKSETGNRLVITSNLVAGNLLPSLIGQSFPSREVANAHVINLLEIAAPTEAVRILREAYNAVYSSILSEAFA